MSEHQALVFWDGGGRADVSVSEAGELGEPLPDPTESLNGEGGVSASSSSSSCWLGSDCRAEDTPPFSSFPLIVGEVLSRDELESGQGGVEWPTLDSTGGRGWISA